MTEDRHRQPPPAPSVLVVDDSIHTQEVIQRQLSSAGHLVYTCSGVSEGVAFLEDNPIDLVITDLRMPKTSGMDLVKYVRDNLKDTEIMVVTGYPSIAGAVDAIRDGAGEYLVKPFTEDELLAAVTAEHILNVLDGTGGNKSRAAEILGIDRKTLREKLKRIQG